ncbi:MAG TPA: acyltransferase [Candidatus Angelobacter sp.]|nr:acyltransferase [Candidatus Angelobacter sp.]
MSVAVAPARAEQKSARSSGRFYQPELDALRFFAFLGVFVFHAAPHNRSFYDAAQVPHWLSSFLISAFGAGAYGVDLFFALSAYLITQLLLRERETIGVVDLRSFYLRRILRIWPLYLSFLVFAVIVGWFIPAQRIEARYLLGFTLLAGNWVYVFSGLPHSFVVPLWTVSIEEQFYLSWPVIVRRISVTGLATVSGGLLLSSHLLRGWMAWKESPANWMEYSTFTRLDPIALGVLLAVCVAKLPKLSGVARVVLLLGGVAGMISAYALSTLDHELTVSTWQLAASHSMTAAASLAILLAHLGSRNPFLRNASLTYLGKISYGLYVVHEFAHMVAKLILPAATPVRVLLQSVVALALTIALAAASYRWLESPFLRMKERFARVQSRPV